MPSFKRPSSAQIGAATMASMTTAASVPAVTSRSICRRAGLNIDRISFRGDAVGSRSLAGTAIAMRGGRTSRTERFWNGRCGLSTSIRLRGVSRDLAEADLISQGRGILSLHMFRLKKAGTQCGRKVVSNRSWRGWQESWHDLLH